MAVRDIQQPVPERLRDRLVVDRERQGLPDTNILQIGISRIEFHHAHAGDGASHDLKILDARHRGELIGRNVGDQIEVAGRKPRDARGKLNRRPIDQVEMVGAPPQYFGKAVSLISSGVILSSENGPVPMGF